MNIRLAVFTAYYLLKEHYKQHDDLFVPYRDASGNTTEETVSAKEAAVALRDLIKHVYPKSESSRYQQVVTCENCLYWRGLKSKRNPRKKRMVCTYGEQRNPTDARFFCGHAREKEASYGRADP